MVLHVVVFAHHQPMSGGRLIWLFKNFAKRLNAIDVIVPPMSVDDGPVDELDVISRLLHLENFARFYSDEWEARNIKIKWRINSSCAMFAMQSFDKSKTPCIVLRQLPSASETIDYSFLVAHEMGHVIKYFDNQYIEFDKALTPIAQIYREEEIIDMGNRLGSMVDDPLIDSFLQDKYGFNPARFYISVIMPDTNKSLDSCGDPPLEWHIFKKAVFFSQFSLQWDAIKDIDALSEWGSLKERYNIRRPRVARIGKELYSLSKDNGYSDAEKQRKPFRIIFNKY